jgi:hypothetical protein
MILWLETLRPSLELELPLPALLLILLSLLRLRLSDGLGLFFLSWLFLLFDTPGLAHQHLDY